MCCSEVSLNELSNVQGPGLGNPPTFLMLGNRWLLHYANSPPPSLDGLGAGP
jgi:hypothetical protein